MVAAVAVRQDACTDVADLTEVHRTRRIALVERMRGGVVGFEALRRELGLSSWALEEDLRHVERSVGRSGERIDATPAECLRCGFLFDSRRLHTPGRCPTCNGERIADTILSIEPTDHP